MASFNKFEEIIAWQKARDLTLIVYRCYRDCRDYGFKDQIQRAIVSVMNNIAEGHERRSNKEMRQFLYIAKGSIGEVRSMNYLGFELNYISDEKYNEIYTKSLELSKVISGFIKSLN